MWSTTRLPRLRSRLSGPTGASGRLGRVLHETQHWDPSERRWLSQGLDPTCGHAYTGASEEFAMLARTASMDERIAMYNGNALKIGVFGANCSSGRSATRVAERWSASWPDCLRLARMADAAGIDFMLPI